MLRKGLFRPSADDEVDADVAFHLEMTTRDLVRQGMTEQQARAEAQRRFGDVDALSAECRTYARERDSSERRAELRSELRQDLTFGVRQLLRTRGFSTVAVLTLALGFGATAAVFSALYAVVLRPLPFDHPERVVILTTTRKGEPAGASAPDFLAIRDHARRPGSALDAVAGAVLQSGFTVRFGEMPELIGGGRVTPEYFRVFGVRPQLGRTFTDDEDVPGRDNVIILSHRGWTSRFNQDAGIIGRVLQVNGAPRTVIGVMPASFDLTPGSDEVWVPLALTPEQGTKFGERFLSIVGRVRGESSQGAAAEQATTAMRAAIAADPDRRLPVTDFSVIARPYVDDFVGDYRALLTILLGAVSFVLLIACTNVANLLIARGTTRARELSIRAALGAGRGRLVRQLLTESLVLSMTAAIVGLGVAYGLLRLVLGVSPGGIPRLEQARVDGNVLLFTIAVAVAATLIFGLLPALRTAGSQLERALREGGRAVRGGRDRVRGALVAIEVALAMTLLVGAGLLIRSAWLLQQVEPGFEPRGVLTSRILLPAAPYPDPPAITGFYDRLYQRANGTPGVSSAALVSVVPLSGSSMQASVLSEDQSTDEAKPLIANLRLASPRYFETMRIPILVGRDIAVRDDDNAPDVLVVNEALAAKLWPGRPARAVIGKRVSAMSGSRANPHWMEIVGVVGNLHSEALSSPVAPEFYAPVAQTPAIMWPLIQRSLVLVMRGVNSAAPSEALTKPLRAAVASIDPSLAVADVEPMEGFLRSSQATARFNTLLLATLGAIALLLAMIGVYGVVSYFVNQRRQEIAIRMALGATPKQIFRYVTTRGLRPIGVGLVLGGALAIVAAGVLESQLYRVTRTDPLVIAGTGLLLLLVALVATYLPARRAVRVAPSVALTE